MERITPSGGHKLSDTLKVLARSREDMIRRLRMARGAPILAMGARPLLAAIERGATNDELRSLTPLVEDGLTMIDGGEEVFTYQDEILAAVSPPSRLDKLDLSRTRDFVLLALEQCQSSGPWPAIAALRKAIIDTAAAHGAPLPTEETPST